MQITESILWFDYQKKFVKSLIFIDVNPGPNNFRQLLYFKLRTQIFLQELPMPENV